MKGFLARWVEGGESAVHGEGADSPSSLGQPSTQAAATALSDPTNDSAEAGTQGVPWAEWKAGQLNRVFEEQGVTGKSGRIAAETVCRSTSDETGKRTEKNKGVQRACAFETAQSAREDPSLTEAIHEVAGLLATAYKRSSALQWVGSDQQADSGDGELANSRTSSVHGVVT